MYIIPNLIAVNYGRTQLFQVECLRCKTQFFPSGVSEIEAFCEDCLNFSKTTLLKYIKDENLSEYNYLGNIIDRRSKSEISLKRSRDNFTKVLKRDDYTCQYCGHKNKEDSVDFVTMTVDHILPWCLGGTNKIENLATACHDCNTIAFAKVFRDFEEKKIYILKRRINKGLYVSQGLIDRYSLIK